MKKFLLVMLGVCASVVLLGLVALHILESRRTVEEQVVLPPAPKAINAIVEIAGNKQQVSTDVELDEVIKEKRDSLVAAYQKENGIAIKAETLVQPSVRFEKGELTVYRVFAIGFNEAGELYRITCLGDISVFIYDE